MRAALSRAPVLLASQLGGLPSDLASFLPPLLFVAFVALAFALLAVVVWALGPTLRRDPVARFWAAGMVLSVVPACASDTLFRRSIGRTDLWGGDGEAILRSIRNKMLSLGDATRVITGHGPATTIGEERRANPFLRGLGYRRIARRRGRADGRGRAAYGSGLCGPHGPPGC